MAAARSLGKSAIWALAICAILSLQGAEAQNCTDSTYVPGWGIAIIVMVAILLLACMCGCGIMPLICKKRDDGCQSGFSFGK